MLRSCLSTACSSSSRSVRSAGYQADARPPRSRRTRCFLTLKPSTSVQHWYAVSFNCPHWDSASYCGESSYSRAWWRAISRLSWASPQPNNLTFSFSAFFAAGVSLALILAAQSCFWLAHDRTRGRWYARPWLLEPLCEHDPSSLYYPLGPYYKALSTAATI